MSQRIIVRVPIASRARRSLTNLVSLTALGVYIYRWAKGRQAPAVFNEAVFLRKQAELEAELLRLKESIDHLAYRCGYYVDSRDWMWAERTLVSAERERRRFESVADEYQKIVAALRAHLDDTSLSSFQDDEVAHRTLLGQVNGVLTELRSRIERAQHRSGQRALNVKEVTRAILDWPGIFHRLRMFLFSIVTSKALPALPPPPNAARAKHFQRRMRIAAPQAIADDPSNDLGVTLNDDDSDSDTDSGTDSDSSDDEVAGGGMVESATAAADEESSDEDEKADHETDAVSDISSDSEPDAGFDDEAITEETAQLDAEDDGLSDSDDDPLTEAEDDDVSDDSSDDEAAAEREVAAAEEEDNSDESDDEQHRAVGEDHADSSDEEPIGDNDEADSIANDAPPAAAIASDAEETPTG
eukprot:TRINITY_DN2367_c1_g2_i1.p1 TRINITY_DN2367_c1_g2~~TRINITY_DN2367_c1_g2_i1.p1  ORF type:complete len:414 (-),score=114.30 TRINITY_DN2367_c1_g2_i1:192-1433(-)